MLHVRNLNNFQICIYVGGLFSLKMDLKTGTKGYHDKVGVLMAIEDINKTDSILVEYALNLLVADTK